jgi:hypothetical protein
MKFGWRRGVPGPLRIVGRRLDDPGPPLRAHIPAGYANTGFQPTYMIFPAEGCWEISGNVGPASLTFVLRVIKIDDGPRRIDDAVPEALRSTR